MSDGVINSPSGAKVHQTGAAAGIVERDKSEYTQQDNGKHLKKQLKKSYVNHSSVESHTNSRDVSNIPVGKDVNKGVEVTRGSESLVTSTPTNVHGKKDNVSPLKSTSRNIQNITASTADFMNTTMSYQNDSVEDNVASTLSKTSNAVIDTADKITAKSSKSRYFRVAGKAVDSVKITKNSSKFVKTTSTSKKLGRKGVSFVENVSNPIVIIAGNSDDLGSKTIVKTSEATPYVVKTGRVVKNTTKTVAQTASKSARYIANSTKRISKSSVKYTQKMVKAARRAAQATAHATETIIVKAGAKLIHALSNPVTAVIAILVIVAVIIFIMCVPIMGTVQYSSYGGVGNNQVLALNDYSTVYDYVNKAITQRNLDLFNLQDTYRDYLEYEYKYQIENDDGTITTSTIYPIADVSPIMAYLSITYESYTLDTQIKNEIDNIVEKLYTFSHETEPHTVVIDHGSGGIERIEGERIILTVTYHNASKFFENNGYIPTEKMTAYAAVKSYGDISYFRMYNIFKEKNWREWIKAPYGHSIQIDLNDTTDKLEYSLIQRDYCILDYTNADNDTSPDVYSPITGKVTKVTNDGYDREIVITDSENDLEFTIIVPFADRLDLMVNQGDTVTAGQKIATRDYEFYIKCKSGGKLINPMLIMEYYQHAGN